MSVFLDLAEFLQALVGQGGYAIVFLAMVLEGVLTPIPSAAILPFAGHQAAQGGLLLPLVILVAAAGATVGSTLAYGIGRRLGRPLLLRYGRFFRIEARHLNAAEGWFHRWGNWAVFLANSFTGFRSIIAFPAGIGRMPLRTFVPFTFAGALVWTTLLVSLGYFLGEAAFALARSLESFDLWVVVGLGAALLVFFLHRRWQRGRREAAEADAP